MRSVLNVMQLPRLTSSRSFAALAVLAYHLTFWGMLPPTGGIISLGYTGVAYFFVLSGFVLAWGTPDGLSPLRFYRRRFARIWPSHVVMLAAAALLPAVQVARSLQIALPNAALLQAWSTDYRVAYGMNGVSWSLSCEAFFYLMFPVAIRIAQRLRIWWQVAAITVVVLLEVAATLRSPDLAEHLPLVRLPEFLLGVLAGRAFRDGWRPRVPLWAALGGVLVAAALSVRLREPLPDLTLVLPFLALVLALAGRDVQDRRGVLTRPLLVLAGEASFAFYLVHELVLVNVQRAMGSGVAAAAIIVALSVVCAAALHLLIERPCNRLLRDRVGSTALASPEHHRKWRTAEDNVDRPRAS